MVMMLWKKMKSAEGIGVSEVRLLLFTDGLL